MADGDQLCSCEAVSRGSLGVVKDEERVARIAINPIHLRKDGSFKPGMFPIGHIKTQGLSLIRVDHMKTDEIERFAVFLATGAEGEAIGVRLCKVDSLRAITDDSGVRSLCVVDDPIVNDKKFPDNLAHAMAIRSSNQDDSEIVRLQGVLVKLFGDLVKMNAIHSAA